MRKPNDLTGKTFGRLTVIERAENSKDGRAKWLCRCECGKQKVVIGNKLRENHTKSCGCLITEKLRQRSTMHGMSGSNFYNVWKAIIRRCTNPNVKAFRNYGGRGITICDRWRNSFPAFLADMGEPPEGCEIDRIDNNGNYEPGNCRWVTRKKNCRNTRHNHMVTFNGKEMCLIEAGELTGINYDALERRINKLGWTIERALTTPVQKCTRKPKIPTFTEITIDDII